MAACFAHLDDRPPMLSVATVGAVLNDAQVGGFFVGHPVASNLRFARHLEGDALFGDVPFGHDADSSEKRHAVCLQYLHHSLLHVGIQLDVDGGAPGPGVDRRWPPSLGMPIS